MRTDDDHFITTRRRDATAVIRGFVYQVAVTLERWVNLDEHALLFLEAGEDVDMVARTMLADGTDLERRVLEQIKDLSANLTLRSVPAIDALACFIEHRSNNPSVDVAFRFTTTASLGVEKPSPLGQSAIEVWQELRGQNLGAKAAAMRDGIREILRSATKPPKLAPTTWTRFETFVSTASDDALDEVIEKFEWSSSCDSFSPCEQTVRRQLAQRFGSDDCYQVLFLHVLKLLSTDGVKKLQAAEVERVVADADRPARQVAARVVAPILDVLRQEVVAPIQGMAQDVADLRRRFDTALTAIDQRPTVAIAVAGRLEIRQSAPSLGARLVGRDSLIAEIRTARNTSGWLAIVGGVGTGKSSTLVLAATGCDEWLPVLWLSFRDASPEMCAAVLQEAIRLIVQNPPNAASLRTVVLDDLPRLTSGDMLADGLRALREHLPESTSIVSTSAHHVPPSIKNGSGSFAERELPWFDSSDVQALLAAHGCPPQRLLELSDAVHALTEGHPTLCVGVADALARATWDATVLGDLTRLPSAELTKEEVFERLLRTTGDSADCRELLWRGALAQGRVSVEQLMELARVPPILNVGDTCIHRAKGVWLRSEGDQKWSVSPLLRLDAESRVTPTVARQVYSTLGDSLLKSGSVPAEEMARAIGYFVRAGDWSRVGGHLLMVLRSIAGPDLAEWQRFFLGMAGALRSRVPHPELLCVERIRLLSDAKCSEDWACVDGAVADAGTPAGVLLYVSVRLGLREPRLTLARSLALATRVASLLESAGQEPSDDRDISQSLHELLPVLFWQAADAVTDPDGLLEWAKAIIRLPVATRSLVMGNRRASLVVSGVVRVSAASSWNHGATVAPPQETLNAFDEVATLSLSAGCELLAAASIRAHTIFQAEVMGKREKAIQYASASVERLRDDWPIFLVKEAIATQHLFGGRPDEARAIYTSLLSEPPALPQIEVVDAFLRLACVSDRDAALAATERSLAIARELSGSAAMLVRGGLERSVALWQVGRTLEALRQALDLLEFAINTVRAGDDSMILRCMIGLGGHAMLFMDCMIRSGRPPNMDASSFEPPFQGMFLNAPAQAASWGDDAAIDRLEGVVVRASALVGDRERALRLGSTVWKRAATMGAKERSLILPCVADSLAANAILDGRHNDALSILHAGIAATLEHDADSPDRAFADREAIEIGFSVAVLSLLWSELEGSSVRDSWGKEICLAVSLADSQRRESIELWKSVASVVGLATAGSGWAALHHATTPDALYAAKSLLASAAEDATPRISAGLQVLAFTNLSSSLRAFPAMGEWIPGLALTTYWRRRLQAERFRFAAPSHVDRVLNQAATNPSKSVKMLLQEVVHATGARRDLPPAAVAWLEEDDAQNLV